MNYVIIQTYYEKETRKMCSEHHVVYIQHNMLFLCIFWHFTCMFRYCFNSSHLAWPHYPRHLKTTKLVLFISAQFESWLGNQLAELLQGQYLKKKPRLLRHRNLTFHPSWLSSHISILVEVHYVTSVQKLFTLNMHKNSFCWLRRIVKYFRFACIVTWSKYRCSNWALSSLVPSS